MRPEREREREKEREREQVGRSNKKKSRESGKRWQEEEREANKNEIYVYKLHGFPFVHGLTEGEAGTQCTDNGENVQRAGHDGAKRDP